MLVIGLMSGTSADGIDATLVDIQGAPPALQVHLLQHIDVSYDPALRDEIFACFRPETGAVDRICQLNFALGEAFAVAALQCIEAAGLPPSRVDLIGSHGQTIWHVPPMAMSPGSTLQLGEAAVIAERTGITTISNFRSRDIAAGGHGAPLVSFVDWLLFRHHHKTRVLQNIGGIANATYLPPLSAVGSSQAAIAFDTGPGNMLIDDAARRATEGAWEYDRNGELAARGHVDEGLLAELLDHPYLKLPPPKTTGREEFGTQMGARIWIQAEARGLSLIDVVATVTAFTAHSIVLAYRDFLPASPDEVILSGGGAQNPILVGMLRQLLTSALLMSTDDVGVPNAAKEAVAFAVLAYESWHNRPGTLSSCTGARHAATLGAITPGNNYAALLGRLPLKEAT